MCRRTEKRCAHKTGKTTGQTSSLISVRADTAEKTLVQGRDSLFLAVRRKEWMLFAPDGSISITDICEQIKGFTVQVRISEISSEKLRRKAFLHRKNKPLFDSRFKLSRSSAHTHE